MRAFYKVGKNQYPVSLTPAGAANALRYRDSIKILDTNHDVGIKKLEALASDQAAVDNELERNAQVQANRRRHSDKWRAKPASAGRVSLAAEEVREAVSGDVQQTAPVPETDAKGNRLDDDEANDDGCDVVVTRHPALLEYLREIGLAGIHTTVLSHASKEDVTGKRVCGVLPHSLSCLCKAFTEIPLAVPQELRGKELTIRQIKEIAGKPVTYVVRVI